MNKIITPKGTKDILFDECSRKRKLVNKLINYYESCGFDEISTPLLEYYNIFDNHDNSMDDSYKLIDTEGQVLVLRPECTTPIARVIGSKLKDRKLPVKLCYNKNVYRSFKNLYGKQDEFTQSGVEMAGCGGIKADSEILITAINALQISGIKKFKIELGHVGIFKSLIEKIDFLDDDLESARNYIENKNIIGLEEILKKYEDNKYSTLLCRLPEMFGNEEIFEKASVLLSGTGVLEYIEYLKKLYEIMKKCGYEEYITLDFGLVHHINYYTGIVFRGYAEGCGDAVISGGRYDNLIEKFGERTDAVGFAIQLDMILNCIEKNVAKEKNKIVIHYYENFENEAFDMYNKFNNENTRIYFSPYCTAEESTEYAKSIGAGKIYIVNENIKEIKL